MKKKQCPFCNIGTTKKGRIFFLEPLNPVTEGHLLIIPTGHYSSFATDPEVSAYVMNSASTYIKLKGGSWNIITSVGKSATQSVFHLHVHLVPRRKGDKLKLPWTDQIKNL